MNDSFKKYTDTLQISVTNTFQFGLLKLEKKNWENRYTDMKHFIKQLNKLQKLNAKRSLVY